MKKTYQNPVIKIIQVKPMLLTGGSTTIGIGSNYNGSSDIESRQSTFWDDDEE